MASLATEATNAGVRGKIAFLPLQPYCLQCFHIAGWFIKIQIGLTFLVPDYSGCRGKEAVKWVSV